MRKINVNNVNFSVISENTFKKKNFSNLLFFILSQSGGVDKRGNIYLFTSDKAYFMDKTKYTDGFIDRLLDKFGDWNLINMYFCDFIIIKPEIYKKFVTELCSRNIRDFWFETTFKIYKECKF